jgi:hypothetical protein
MFTYKEEKPIPLSDKQIAARIQWYFQFLNSLEETHEEEHVEAIAKEDGDSAANFLEGRLGVISDLKEEFFLLFEEILYSKGFN